MSFLFPLFKILPSCSFSTIFPIPRILHVTKKNWNKYQASNINSMGKLNIILQMSVYIKYQTKVVINSMGKLNMILQMSLSIPCTGCNVPQWSSGCVLSTTFCSNNLIYPFTQHICPIYQCNLCIWSQNLSVSLDQVKLTWQLSQTEQIQAAHKKWKRINLTSVFRA